MPEPADSFWLQAELQGWELCCSTENIAGFFPGGTCLQQPRGQGCTQA